MRAVGANVIGTVGSETKAELAKRHGCTHVILYREEDVAARVRELTDGRGVDVAYDSVGKDTFEASLDSLHPRGMLVSFGNASGPVEPFSPLLLAQKGGLFVTRPALRHYYTDREESHEGCVAVLDAVVDGGGGTDTLDARGADVDITTFTGTITGIEIIDLTKPGADTVTLSAQDVLDMSDSNTVTVTGGSPDTVEAGTGWTDAGFDGSGNHIYTQIVGDTLATLLLDPDVAPNADIIA